MNHVNRVGPVSEALERFGEHELTDATVFVGKYPDYDGEYKGRGKGHGVRSSSGNESKGDYKHNRFHKSGGFVRCVSGALKHFVAEHAGHETVGATEDP